MDPQFTATREELYHVQMDVKHVQAVQNNHSDRLMRLEKRQADDAALKSVWNSPFPSVLSGTPQQGPVQNPPADVFDDFDDEQGQNLLGSLQLEADEEPVRRGASRANSVRFDVSALQGSNWTQGSRSSGEFGPLRPNSGFGNHPMTERSLSHKSDGRHSSAGHSVHSMHSVPSGRTSSLGLDTNFIISGQDNNSPLDIPDPPPGLFVLGSVPSIIRCWLTTDFSHGALLYAVVCTGSQRSVLDYSLIKELGLLDQMQKDSSGRYIIRAPVYLPEAIITQPTSRSNSPAPQLPTLTADFEIMGMTQHATYDRKNAIRVFLGSDTLRAHNADLLFSQNLMTLYGNDRNKLSVPFVRPEDENIFKYLCTTNLPTEKNELKATTIPFTATEQSKIEPTSEAITNSLAGGLIQTVNTKSADSDHHPSQVTESPSPFTTVAGSSEGDFNSGFVVTARIARSGNVSDSDRQRLQDNEAGAESHILEPEPSDASELAEAGWRGSSGGIWGSWRHGSVSMNGSENGRDVEPTSGYQRANRRGRSMKVLKPSKSIAPAVASTRSSSAAHTGAVYEPAPQCPSGESRRKSQVCAENVPLRFELKRAVSDEQKTQRTITTIPRSSNPGSAFSWMNPGKPKASATTAE